MDHLSYEINVSRWERQMGSEQSCCEFTWSLSCGNPGKGFKGHGEVWEAIKKNSSDKRMQKQNKSYMYLGYMCNLYMMKYTVLKIMVQ